MTRFARFYLVIFLIAVAFMVPTANSGESIKLATLAPRISPWMLIFKAMEKEIREKSEGELGIQFYPDGIQGDEIDVIRKMRAGLPHAGALTYVGLGEIYKPVLIFQTMRLFHNYAELDYVRDGLRDQLDEAFEGAGYILLGWGDIGYFYLFNVSST